MTKYKTEEEVLEARKLSNRKCAQKRRDKKKAIKIEAGIIIKVGRPLKYDSDEERLKAKRKQINDSVLRLYHKKKKESLEKSVEVEFSYT